MEQPINPVYDAVPYPSLSYAQSHPSRLAVVATLMGLTPPPVTRCRVLELGCAGGGNLVPMAYTLPESEFVGVDNARRQIEAGRAMIAALGLRNVRLLHRDIRALDDDLGDFDYIIAHGVFSWVPADVRQALLDYCRRHLTPNGVAYVSYNTYPGWHQLRIVRDLMRYHTRTVDDPAARARQARAFLDAFAEALPDGHTPYAGYIKLYARFLRGEAGNRPPKDDAFLLHDELEEVNAPFYFHEFVEMAARHGLRYLGEADYHTMSTGDLPPAAVQLLQRTARNAMEIEQYLDFLRGRTFRQTLLCHAERPVRHAPDPSRLYSLHIASRARPAASEGEEAARFTVPNGPTLTARRPLTQAALHHLAEQWPRPVPFAALIEAARARLGRPADDPNADRQRLAADLLYAYRRSNQLVELYAFAPPLTTRIADRPVASAVARYQARQSVRVSNLRHERITLDPLSRALLPLLDGTRDLPALVEALTGQGIHPTDADGSPLPAETLADEVTLRLRWMAQAALLVSTGET